MGQFHIILDHCILWSKSLECFTCSRKNCILLGEKCHFNPLSFVDGAWRSKFTEIKSYKHNGVKKILWYYQNLFCEHGKMLSIFEDFILYIIYSTEIIGVGDLFHVP